MPNALKMTEEEYEKYMEKFGQKKIEKKVENKPIISTIIPKKHKYNVGDKEKRMSDGILFSSIKEKKYYEQLKNDPDVLFFLRQVPIRFKSNCTYWVDFLVWYKSTPKPKFIEVKGMKTKVYKIKRKLLASEYPYIEIEEV